MVFGFLAVAAFGQQPAATPKKDPFAGFGNTGLDRRPAPSTGVSPFGRPASKPPLPQSPPTANTAPTASPSSSSSSTSGIALADRWAGHLTQSAGGQTMKMHDLQALLASYGSAASDTNPHPDVTVYEGPRMDGPENCRVTYLMPLDKAEAQLTRNRGIVTVTRAVAPGFPDGLFIHTYDVHFGIYNRLCIVTDSAKPVQQVVSLLLKAETANWYPASPPFKKLERDWHTHDYVNTDNRGQSGIAIDTRVNDRRGAGHFIIANMTGGSMPPQIPPPGILFKPARNPPKQTATWYVPEPLIKLILYSLSQQIGG